MSRVGKLGVLLQRIPPDKIDPALLAASYHLPLPFVQGMVADALRQRGIRA